MPTILKNINENSSPQSLLWLKDNWTICKKIVDAFNRKTNTIYSTFVSGNGHSSYTWDEIFNEAYLAYIESFKNINPDKINLEDSNHFSEKVGYGNFYAVFCRNFIDRLKKLAEPFHNTYRLKDNGCESFIGNPNSVHTKKVNGITKQVNNNHFKSFARIANSIPRSTILKVLNLMPNKRDSERLYMLFFLNDKNLTSSLYCLTTARINQLIRTFVEIHNNIEKYQLKNIINHHNLSECLLALNDENHKEFLLVAHTVFDYKYSLLIAHFNFDNDSKIKEIFLQIHNSLNNVFSDREG
tara:strand:- start:2129 stop:3022 length:894 start_codon:yes stop_codon:yes gene_type:complete